MKRIKEALWFVVPLVGLAGLSLLLFLFPIGESPSFSPAFTGPDEYRQLFLNDPVFYKAVVFTYLLTTLYALVGIAIFTLIGFLIRRKVRLSRPVYYAISGIVGCLTVFFANMSTIIVGARSFISWDLLLNNIVTALQCGILALFAVWVIEMVWRLIRRAKENA